MRSLLNTWVIPNDTRRAEDRFDAYTEAAGVPPVERADLRELRDDLRAIVEGQAEPDPVLNTWLERLRVCPHVEDGAVGYQHHAGAAGDALVAVLVAIGSGRWSRLKACPDCRWVFYDHTRNASKRWCLMTAGGPDGRSCGSIAKVRAYRDRARRRGR